MTLTVLKSEADAETFYTAKEIRLNGRDIKTPIPLIHSEVENTQLPISLQDSMVEIWKTLDFKKNEIGQLNSDNAINAKIGSELNRSVPSNLKNRMKCYFISFKGFPQNSNPFALLDEDTCSYFLDQIRQLSDFITIPIIHNFEQLNVNDALFEDYEHYVRSSVETARVLNTKPIMAIVPFIARKFMKPVAELFLSLDVSCFCFDFNGHTLATHFPHYMQFLRTLYLLDRSKFQKSVIYAINLKMPSNAYRNHPFPAEDMVLPAIGADFIGFNHVGGFKKKKSKKGGAPKPPAKKQIRVNLLNAEDYLYYRIGTINEFHTIFPNPIIPLTFQDFSQVSTNMKNEFKRGFDFCQKNQEFSQIHKVIMNNESVMTILNQKKGIQQDIRSKIRSLKGYVNTRSITDFL